MRKQECQRLKRALPKAESTELQGALWPCRKRPTDLKPPEWELLERVFSDSPQMEAADHWREDLTELCARRYEGGGHMCDAGLVPAGAGQRAG